MDYIGNQGHGGILFNWGRGLGNTNEQNLEEISNIKYDTVSF